MWLSLTSLSVVMDANEKTDDIALNMTDDEIDEARRMAHDWRAQKA
jgi:hypothetical protein